MLGNLRTRKAAKVFVAKNGESEFVTARKFTHARHLDQAALVAGVDIFKLYDAVLATGLEIGFKWVVRYEREDGNFREIVLSSPTPEQAVEIANRRLREQYGDGVFDHERRQQDQNGDGSVTPEANLLRDRPDLHQDNYELVSVTRG